MEPTLESQIMGVALIATITFIAGWYGSRMDARKRAKKESLERMQEELMEQYEEDLRLYHMEQRQAEIAALAMARKGITPAFEYF